jgi:hypothetical protein
MPVRRAVCFRSYARSLTAGPQPRCSVLRRHALSTGVAIVPIFFANKFYGPKNRPMLYCRCVVVAENFEIFFVLNLESTGSGKPVIGLHGYGASLFD